MKPDNSIYSICTILYTETSDFVSNQHGPHSDYRSELASPVLYTIENK